jgi:uncharacterized cupin superfamily protein
MPPNIDKADFDEPRDHEGFRARRARLSRQAGAQRLGLSLWEVDPGQAAYPYHAHLTEEEIVIVLDGAQGAHQIVNRTSEPVRFLAFSPCGEPDVVIQPDSGKIGVFERRPDGSGMRLLFRREDERDYYDGESPPA